MKTKLKEFIVKHETEKWLKDNPDLVKDMTRLCTEAVMFKIKWGIPVVFAVDEDYKEETGRMLGMGEVEYIFKAKKKLI